MIQKSLLLLTIIFLASQAYTRHHYNKIMYTGRAESYGAPDIRLIIDMVNDCHFRMRYYYFLGASPPSVMFGTYKFKNRKLILIDGHGNKVVFYNNGYYMVGNDNGYRIFIRRIR